MTKQKKSNLNQSYTNYGEDQKFEEYMGELFYEIINEYSMVHVNSVVELAPGFRYKIAYALSKINFKGDFYIIDSNENVLKYIEKKYKLLLPGAKIITINCSLKNSINLLPQNIDLFLSNHATDDVIISKYINNEQLKEAFNNTSKSQTILLNAWESLCFKESEKLELQEKVFKEFIDFINEIQIKLIILSQYKSAYYKDKNNYVEKLSAEILEMIKNKITRDEVKIKKALSYDYDDFDVALCEGYSLKENIQNEKNWIIGGKK